MLLTDSKTKMFPKVVNGWATIWLEVKSKRILSENQYDQCSVFIYIRSHVETFNIDFNGCKSSKLNIKQTDSTHTASRIWAAFNIVAARLATVERN